MPRLVWCMKLPADVLHQIQFIRRWWSFTILWKISVCLSLPVFNLTIFLCLFFFFCLCCYSFLYDLLCPSASASSMHRSLLPASSCVQNLTTVASICNCAVSTNFRSRFKMVFVRTIFHYELALLWPVCCPFHSHFLCLVSTCSQFLHVILPKLVLVIFSVFIVLYLNVL